MLYSKTASILGSRGWIPLKAGDTIISELVVLNDLRNRISQIDGDITSAPSPLSAGFRLTTST